MLSPGVEVKEFDLTTVVPAVATTVGAIAGIFRWGPVEERRLVDSENSLKAQFGGPTNLNAETWFTAANFLSYGDNELVVRVANTTATDANVGAWNAMGIIEGGTVANVQQQVVKNEEHYGVKDGTFDTDILWLAKFPGKMGNSLRVSSCDSANAFNETLDLSTGTVTGTISINVGSNSALVSVSNTGAGTIDDANTYIRDTVQPSLAVGDLVEIGNSSIGRQFMKVTSVGSVASNSTFVTFTIGFEDPMRLHTDFSSDGIPRWWEFYSVVDAAPGQSTYQSQFGNTAANDEIHVVVVDEGGEFSGVPGTILEVFKAVSRATDAKNENNTTNYYKEVINKGSRYIWWANDDADAPSNTAVNLVSSAVEGVNNVRFVNGNDGLSESAATLSVLATGYDYFASAEDVDVSLVMQGKPVGGPHKTLLANYIIDNICEPRMDCVAFVSPHIDTVVNNFGQEADDIVTVRNNLRSTSYAFLDSGYKYQYDRYNDVYRWIPLNGDMAGLCARTDETNDPWWSPAGFNRGRIKNLVKLAWNPRKAARDVLYKNGINPVATFPGDGTVLYGDKTLLAKPSAFDRINVRRLFIVLEKAIATAAKYSLFEFNDAFTRAQFKNLVEPYLRDIQGRRGITDFLVVCDETNNTGQVIDTNRFVADIYIKPARSINFITLNFIAVGTAVQFSEVVGRFG